MSQDSQDRILSIARRVLDVETRALSDLSQRLGEEFVRSVEILLACKGRVVLTGMGKSGLVCRKIAATFASTGTPSLFMHPAEGGHGDLGMLVRGDVLIAASYSGETEEMIRILPAVKRLGIPMICMTGCTTSTLASRSDVVLDISVAEEACSLGLAPTSSTTATLALGDSLAVALLEVRGFTEEDFATFHPSGALGRRLLTVADIMHVGADIPRVRADALVRDTLYEITSKKLGFTTVEDGQGRLVGIITDGDLRRLLEREEDPLVLSASDIMSTGPKVIDANALAARALQVMETHTITSLVIVDDAMRTAGVLHLHDILRAGVA